MFCLILISMIVYALGDASVYSIWLCKYNDFYLAFPNF